MPLFIYKLLLRQLIKTEACNEPNINSFYSHAIKPKRHKN
jgi:hypothetical protein